MIRDGGTDRETFALSRRSVLVCCGILRVRGDRLQGRGLAAVARRLRLRRRRCGSSASPAPSPLWLVGFACAVAAVLLAAGAQAARPGTRNAWLLGALGVIALGGIIGFVAGALLRGV